MAVFYMSLSFFKLGDVEYGIVSMADRRKLELGEGRDEPAKPPYDYD